MISRRRTYEILELSRRPDRAAWWVDAVLIALIVSNVLAAILETVPEIEAAGAYWFHRFEVISVAIFTVEYALRLWVAVEAPGDHGGWKGRLRHAATPGALIDLAAILPFYLGMFFSLDLRMLRIFRLLRLFKLSRYSPAFGMLAHVVRREAATLAICSAILAALLVVTATGAYIVERRAQPEAFGSIPAAMWWAMATLTTVGYGDVTPVTALGKLFGGLVTALGVGMAALPAGILASGLSAELAQRRAALKNRYVQAMLDGRVAHDEAEALEALRVDLDLSREDAEDAQGRARALISTGRICPHCGGDLGAHRK